MYKLGLRGNNVQLMEIKRRLKGESQEKFGIVIFFFV